jgi:hypothetical protein
VHAPRPRPPLRSCLVLVHPAPPPIAARADGDGGAGLRPGRRACGSARATSPVPPARTLGGRGWGLPTGGAHDGTTDGGGRACAGTPLADTPRAPPPRRRRRACVQVTTTRALEKQRRHRNKRARRRAGPARYDVAPQPACASSVTRDAPPRVPLRACRARAGASPSDAASGVARGSSGWHARGFFSWSSGWHARGKWGRLGSHQTNTQPRTRGAPRPH